MKNNLNYFRPDGSIKHYYWQDELQENTILETIMWAAKYNKLKEIRPLVFKYLNDYLVSKEMKSRENYMACMWYLTMVEAAPVKYPIL